MLTGLPQHVSSCGWRACRSTCAAALLVALVGRLRGCLARDPTLLRWPPAAAPAPRRR